MVDNVQLPLKYLAMTVIVLGIFNVSELQAQTRYRLGRLGTANMLQNLNRMEQQQVRQMQQMEAKQMQQMQKAYVEYEKKAQQAYLQQQIELKAAAARRRERLAEEKQARIEKNKKHNAEMAAKGLIKPKTSVKSAAKSNSHQSNVEQTDDIAFDAVGLKSN